VTGPGLHFRRRHRLAHALDYQRVYAGRARKSAHPIVLFAAPNALAHPRLGLSVGRRVGKAHERHRIKRRLREAFRLARHDWPGSYDLVVAVRPHATLPMTEYQRLVADAVAQLHRLWTKRLARQQQQQQQQ